MSDLHYMPGFLDIQCVLIKLTILCTNEDLHITLAQVFDLASPASPAVRRPSYTCASLPSSATWQSPTHCHTAPSQVVCPAAEHWSSSPASGRAAPPSRSRRSTPAGSPTSSRRRVVRRRHLDDAVLGHGRRLRTARQPRLRRRLIRHLLLPAARRHGDRLRPHLPHRSATGARNIQARDVTRRLRRAAYVRESTQRGSEICMWHRRKGLESDKNTRNSDGHVLPLLVPVFRRIRYSSFLPVMRLPGPSRLGNHVTSPYLIFLSCIVLQVF